ncbi:11890_t:CDS:2 [Funneliformis geosporum]|nr:11890_t:CDS:2 [Funneliformis geosporum]
MLEKYYLLIFKKKAYDFIKVGLYKQESNATAIQEKTKFLKKENNQLKKVAMNSTKQNHSLNIKITKANSFKLNKKEYTPQFVKLATEISNIDHNSINLTIESTKAIYGFLTGETSTKWISASTLANGIKKLLK